MSARQVNAIGEGRRIEDYVVERVLGADRYCVYYRARHRDLGRRFRIAEYLPRGLAVRGQNGRAEPASADKVRDYTFGLGRFVAEADTLARVSHPNIQPVHDCFSANGTAYLVNPWRDGETLEWLLRARETLGEQDLRELTFPLLDGMSAMHKAGVMHCNICPATVHISATGVPYFRDFGAARHALGCRRGNLAGLFAPGYAPAELFDPAHAPEARTDIYALGATLYRAVAGAPPPEAAQRLVNDKMIPASKFSRKQFGAAPLAAIDRALAVRVGDRPSDAETWRKMFVSGPRPRAAEKSFVHLDDVLAAPDMDDDTEAWDAMLAAESPPIPPPEPAVAYAPDGTVEELAEGRTRDQTAFQPVAPERPPGRSAPPTMEPPRQSHPAAAHHGARQRAAPPPRLGPIGTAVAACVLFAMIGGAAWLGVGLIEGRRVAQVTRDAAADAQRKAEAEAERTVAARRAAEANRRAEEAHREAQAAARRKSAEAAKRRAEAERKAAAERKRATEAAMRVKRETSARDGEAAFQQGYQRYHRDKDYGTALQWFRKAAELGHVRAQFTLGHMYDLGRGTPRDPKVAAKWFLLAARQGHIDAQYNVAHMYATGLGLSKDYGAALKWFRKAAEQCDVSAQASIGFMYGKGLGVARDPREAYFWYRLALTSYAKSAGTPDKRLKRLYLRSLKTVGELENELTAADRQSVERRVQAWRPKGPAANGCE